MKKIGILILVFALTAVAGMTTGCEQKSDLEKTADSAAKDVDNALK